MLSGLKQHPNYLKSSTFSPCFRKDQVIPESKARENQCHLLKHRTLLQASTWSNAITPEPNYRCDPLSGLLKKLQSCCFYHRKCPVIWHSAHYVAGYSTSVFFLPHWEYLSMLTLMGMWKCTLSTCAFMKFHGNYASAHPHRAWYSLLPYSCDYCNECFIASPLLKILSVPLFPSYHLEIQQEEQGQNHSAGIVLVCKNQLCF